MRTIDRPKPIVKPQLKPLKPIDHSSVLPQLRQGLNGICWVSAFVAPFVFQLDPVTGTWIGWGTIFIFVLNHFAIPKIAKAPRYLSGVLLLMVLGGGFLSALYVDTATGWLLCLPSQNEAGPLRPSELLTPPNPCLDGSKPENNDRAFIFFGSNVGAVSIGQEIDIVGVDNGPTLVKGTIASDGALSLAAKIYDREGVFLAEVENGKLETAGSVCVKRPDLSTFIVQDFHKHELLYVHYLNPHAIDVRGIFAYPGTAGVRITRDAIIEDVHHLMINNDCFRGNKLVGLPRLPGSN